MEVDKPSEFEQEFAAAVAGEQAAPAAPPQESAAAPAPAPEPAPAEPAPESKSITLEELQEQLRQVQHQARSDANRVSAFQRENNRLKAMLDELNAKVGRAGAPAPDPATPAKLEEDVLTSAPDLESAVKRRVKEVTAALEDQVKDLSQRVQTVQTVAGEAREAIEPIRQSTVQKQIEETHAALDAQFTPKWRDDLRSPDFEQWLDRQPAYVKDLYATAVTPEDSASVLARFYAGRRPTQIAAAPAPQAPAQAAGNPQTERLRQAAGIAPRGNTRPPTGPADDDFEGHFQQAWRSSKTA